MTYKHGAASPSDPSTVPLKFRTAEEAQAHADRMNLLIETWDETPTGLWNKDYWKTKPEKWSVIVL